MIADRLKILAAFAVVLLGPVWSSAGADELDLAQPVATLEIIGFSEDGAYFAYEIAGVVPGSGGIYSSYAFVDVAANTPAVEPVATYLSGNDALTLRPAAPRTLVQDVRDDNAGRAAPVLDRLGFDGTGHVTLLASAPVDAFTSAMAFDGEGVASGVMLSLRPLDIAVPDQCRHEPSAIGAVLVLESDATEPREIARWDTLPPGRCVVRYALSDVVAFENEPSRLVVLVNSFTDTTDGALRFVEAVSFHFADVLGR